MTGQDSALGTSGRGGWEGKESLGGLGTDLTWDSFCPIGKEPTVPLTCMLSPAFFQQIEMELRQMELIKDQYQKKNYEQVDDF